MRILTLVAIGMFFLINCYSRTLLSTYSSSEVNESNDTLPVIAKEILNGRRIETINLSIIYQIIDSVFTNNSSDRIFYFSVFNEIDGQAKGELSAEMDWKIKDFCYKYPNNFFSISEIKISDYAQRIGELLRTEEEFPQKAATDYIEHIQKLANDEYENRIKTFSLDLMNKVK
jgi:hypothetical protein